MVAIDGECAEMPSEITYRCESGRGYFFMSLEIFRAVLKEDENGDLYWETMETGDILNYGSPHKYLTSRTFRSWRDRTIKKLLDKQSDSKIAKVNFIEGYFCCDITNYDEISIVEEQN